ncbi:MAG TPA: cupin domain-containing protein [Pseudonocardiaceae bacterium]|jgi:quercetin dioxygenase-like cupin family protein
MFYILDGVVDVLSGTDVVRANKGDLLVVPAGVPHAFGAAGGHGAELLIVITPGVSVSNTSATSAVSRAAKYPAKACWQSRNATTPTS